MYTKINGKIYRYIDSEVQGRMIVTSDRKKTDSTFEMKEGYYVRTISNVTDQIKDIYRLEFWVDYEDKVIRDEKKWIANIKRFSKYDIYDDDYTVEISVSKRCEIDGWTMFDPFLSTKDILLSDCTGFYLKYIYSKKENVNCAPSIVEEFKVDKSLFLATLDQYRIDRI